jgi:DNA-binding GntR family transcriptional regulator
MPGLDAPSLREQAYRDIRRRIVTLAYAPGAALNEAGIAGDVGFGRTPVREALDRLQHEGLVDVVPRRGIRVRPIDRGEFRQLLEARRAVEPACAALAAERGTPEEVARLGEICGRMPGDAAHGDTLFLMDLDRDFHAAIALAARSPTLQEFQRIIHERVLRLWCIALASGPRVTQVAAEHDRMVEAIASRDAAAAAAVALAHVESFGHYMEQALERPRSGKSTPCRPSPPRSPPSPPGGRRAGR